MIIKIQVLELLEDEAILFFLFPLGRQYPLSSFKQVLLNVGLLRGFPAHNNSSLQQLRKRTSGGVKILAVAAGSLVGFSPGIGEGGR